MEDYEKNIEIPFGANDSELCGFEYTIPEGYEAEIRDGKVIVRKIESEDERIRKAIYIYLDWLDGKKDVAPKGEYSIRDMIAWLEKQGEHNKFIESIQVGDQVTRNQDGMLVNLSQLKRVAKPSEQNPDKFYEHMFDGIPNSNCPYSPNKEQKPAEWCYDDENILSSVIDEIEANYKEASEIDHPAYIRMLDWLKSLKERVQPQLKQEWREEDEEIIKALYKSLEEIRDAWEWNCIDIGDGKNIYIQDIINWLKSLRPQNRWKPNVDQLDALYDMLRSFRKESSYSNRDNIANIIETLYEQLKAIGGE